MSGPPIVYQDYDPGYSRAFEYLASAIHKAVPAARVEHVGSTSVPGLGLNVVSVTYHQGPRGTEGSHPKMRMGLFVDRDATMLQFKALGAAFSGALGGPLGELAEMVVADPHVDRGAIRFESDGGRTMLSVEGVISTSMTPLIGSTRRITTIADSALATLLGTPGEVGRSDQLLVRLPEQGMQVSVQRRSATRGRFAYVSR